MRQLVCFGDSICRGFGVPAGEAWVCLLAQHVESSHPAALCVINEGSNGDTTQDALERLHVVVEVRRPQLLYVQFGLNDCWAGEDYVPIFIKNIRTICQKALLCGTEHIFVATNHSVCWGPHVADYCDENFRYNVQVYNAALREAWGVQGQAGQERVYLVDVESAFESQNPEHAQKSALLASDGLHLSRQGNVFYGNTVYAAVAPYI